MTQNQALLEYLRKKPKGITVWEAFEYLGICCLHKRIAELEASGHKIERNRIIGKNRYNNTCKVTRYRLKND